MKLLRASLAVLLLVASLPDVLRAEETREKTLPNGLKILVHPLSGAPLVTVMTLYRVGSANEPEGQSGITHLCEHMLFKGSRRFPDGEASQLAARCGGYVNGYTNVDEITFFQVVPREKLLDFLDRHADAMTDATFDPEEFKKEMVVVRSELEGDENNPSWLLDRALFATSFQVHGLHHPVIGWRADVERITAEQVKAWYRTHFRPNNAVVIVVGDVEADSTVAEVEKRFGGIAPGTVPFEPSPEPAQEGERRVTVHAPASSPVVEFGYHNVPTGHPDSFALEVLQEILGKGQSARLYRSLVDQGLATEINVGNYWCRYPTLFTIRATASPGQDPAHIEAALDREVEHVKADLIPEEEVAKCIRQIVRGRAFSLDSTEKVASALADFEAYSSYRYGLGFEEEVSKVTPERVRAAARKYLVRDNRTVGILIPGEKTGAPDLSGAMAEIDRHPKLASGAAGKARSPKPPVEFTLSNGVRVLFWENPSSPTVAIQARWPGGPAREGQRQGTASVALEMLHEGTRAHDKATFNSLLEARGATLENDLGSEYAGATTAGLSEDFETLSSLLAEFIAQPLWPEDRFETARDRVVGRLAEAQDSPEEMGHRAIRNSILSPGHPRHSADLASDLANARSLKLEEVRRFHEELCRPKSVLVAISGALDEARVREIAEKAFGRWKAEGMAPPLAFPASMEKPDKSRVIVFLPEKSEAFGAVAFPSPVRRGDADYAVFDVMNHILGGGAVWTSRLGRKIRVENGLAYDTYSSTTGTLGNGYYFAQFGSNPENVDKALALLKEEIRKIREEGVTEDEVKDAISYKLGAFPRQTETSEQKSRQLLDLAWFEVGLESIARRPEEYRSVTKKQVDAMARKLFDPSRMLEVISGTYGK